MKTRELRTIINKLSEMLEIGEVALKGKSHGITLTDAQKTELKDRYIASKKEILDIAKLLKEDTFDLELDETLED